ncbi:MAG TPA: DUF4190 domain-containing protein [Nocardioides sp.]|uniref:DUF4190 domain-containing protein n=1 Tax=uncultured Nocardioides sp. TaxID=198441 RepID=UPI000EE4B0B5|nr:DUF4190 domain-containing protein [uncultured Nocardioides sp.]HCB03920.1 hypothetical protein [Nocardioides sp.]HRD62007.1 DUF4190 domain-containing protein [Nocardioides sp.]HRI98798.1 DUF4190 domain-containing protein [Nocardioides sp.]HRK48788.1 DUF4190 domain-containing protein [Nocardioides sp.]
MTEPEETAPITPLPTPVAPVAPPTTPYSAPTPAPQWQQPSQQPWQQSWQPAPAYAMTYAPTLSHTGATASLVLGIISVIAITAAPFTCLVTLPGVLCAPFAWVVGARARREIRRFPGTYRNPGAAQAGMWMGIVTTLLGALMIAGVAALIATFNSTSF